MSGVGSQATGGLGPAERAGRHGDSTCTFPFPLVFINAQVHKQMSQDYPRLARGHHPLWVFYSEIFIFSPKLNYLAFSRKTRILQTEIQKEASCMEITDNSFIFVVLRRDLAV